MLGYHICCFLESCIVYVDNFQQYFLYCIAGRLTRSVGVVCPNEPVRYECTVEGEHLKWKVTPGSADRMEQTFAAYYNQPNSSLDLTWSGFHVHLTLVSVTATNMTSTAEFLAVPDFRGTIFQCFGYQTRGELVLEIASEIISSLKVCSLRVTYSMAIIIIQVFT